MSEYTPKNEWHPAIRQFDVNEIVEGGAAGLDNLPHQQLADNDKHIVDRLSVTESLINALINSLEPNQRPPTSGGEPAFPEEVIPPTPTPPTGGGTPTPTPTPIPVVPGWSVKLSSPKLPPDAPQYNFSFFVSNSSNSPISDVSVTVRLKRNDGVLAGRYYTLKDSGFVSSRYFVFSLATSAEKLDNHPTAIVTVSAPGTTTITKEITLWDGSARKPSSGGGSGGNANQTE